MTNIHAILRPGRRAGAFGGVVAATMIVAGCAGTSTAATVSHSSASTTYAATIVTGQAPPPTLTITPSDNAKNVLLNAPIAVLADTGVLDTVVVHSDQDPTPLAGAIGPDRRTWTTAVALDPGLHYTLAATAHSSGGTSSVTSSFTTMPVTARLQVAEWHPDDGNTVGVGMPVILKLNAPVDADKQANLVNHIVVQTSVPVAGAWHWVGNQEIHWRPKDFWPAATKVQVTANLRGVPASSGVWGLDNSFGIGFTIGEKHVSIIDVATHQMQVFQNDQLVHTYPVSAGRPSNPTIGGTLFVQYKLQKVRMVSTSIGIPVGSPDGYNEDVFWDTAISTNGFYIHSAPWSVPQQGVSNVSHGCVNLSQARAIEFWNYSQVGDVVQITNSTRLADYGDGEGDWQIPFAEYANSGGTVIPPPAGSAAGGA